MQSNTFVLEFRSLKQTSRYGAKRRTGCITCKTRRVRCDEGKPQCLRCISAGRVCGRYAEQLKTTQSEHPRGVVQKQTNPLSPLPSTPAFGGDAQYLEFYYHSVCPLFSLGRFDDSFWRCTALQMAHSEEAVQHALLALGCLFKTEPGSLKHARSGRVNSIFLVHYNKAVRFLVDRMNDASYTPQIGFVTALLFVCIEFLRGNHHAAFVHLKGGLNMMAAWHKKKGRSKDVDRNLPYTPSLLHTPGNIESGVMAQDEVTRLFTRTIAPAVLFNVSVGEFLPTSIPRIQIGPFSDILDAQSVGYEFNSPALLYIIMMSRKIMTHESFTPADVQQQRHFLECYHAWFGALRLLEPSLSDTDKITASSLKVGCYTAYIGVACILDISQESYRTHLQSFKYLIQNAKLVLAHIGLHLAAPSTTLSLQTLPTNRPLSPSAANNTSSTSTPSTSHSSHPAANFTFEISLIPSLYFCSLRCRCPTTRREAVSLLELNPPREGLWDAEQHAVVARRIINIEEHCVDDNGWPTEQSRLWCAMIDPNMDQVGGFSVVFALAKWVQEGGQFSRWGEGLSRLAAQWEERFIL